MGFNTPDVGGRDTRCIATKPSVEYNDDGIEIITSSNETSFWGKVTEVKDQGGVSAFKRLDARSIQIEADSRTLTNINILDTLTTDESSGVYEIVDKFDSTWKFTSMLICKYKE